MEQKISSNGYFRLAHANYGLYHTLFKRAMETLETVDEQTKVLDQMTEILTPATFALVYTGSPADIAELEVIRSLIRRHHGHDWLPEIVSLMEQHCTDTELVQTFQTINEKIQAIMTYDPKNTPESWV